MKNPLHIRNVMRSLLFGAAVATASFTFTACETVENLEPTTEKLETVTQNGSIIAGQYIVVFKSNGNMRLDNNMSYRERTNTVRQAAQDIMRSNGVANVAVERAFGETILGITAKLSDSEVENLRKDSRVAFIEPDRIVMLAPPAGKGPKGGGGSAPSEEIPYGINRVGSGSGVGKTAWVIDTGIDLTHPDLNVDASRGFNAFTNGKDGGSTNDGNGHGTHVAGTIGAIKDNGIGVVGVAYGATVIPVKVLDSNGSGSYSGVIAGVDYVAANGSAGDVANMSLGGPVSQALDNAILAAAAKGIKFALAAGNESADANNSSPARVNGTNIFTVSAMDVNDRFASFSNYGNPPIDYCAPGVSITSTWKDGGYNTISGTSMASPHVAGLLLLGNIRNGGTVTGDRDNNPDIIAIK
jgi:subtilisin family serine protease